MRQYITTAIDYPNAAPHMGHVLEKVLADVCARWFRLRGDEVRFQTGTDEHGIKMQRTAEKEGITPRQLADRNVPLFQDICKKLNLSHDFFIRTSNKKVHWPTVIALWKNLDKAGALEKQTYTGLYCSGCERFMTKRDLVSGVCPNHQRAPEEVSEENYFFKLSDYSVGLKNLLTTNWDGEEYRIVPQFRQKETLSLIDQGLEDVSFSRPTSSLAWGIPVPGDSSQTMYVWCDALTNYISGLGLLTDHAETDWWDEAEVTHVIGKDIARFHALIWPAMLKIGGVRTPDRLLIHGFLSSEGQKMSKSLGNVVKPDDVLAYCKGNPDPIRFYLSHEVPVGNDGDFSWERFKDLYDSKLRNELGNLLNRVMVMLKKEGSGLGKFESPTKLKSLVADNWQHYTDQINKFELNGVLSAAFNNISQCNGAIGLHAVWKKEKKEKIAYLTEFAEVLRHVALMLLPFIPDTAYRISKQLNVPYAEEMPKRDFVITGQLKKWGGCKGWKQVGEPEILFKPLE